MKPPDQPALFAINLPPPPPRPRRGTEPPGRPRWSAYKPKNRVPCDDCLLYLAEHDGHGPLPTAARWKRIRGNTMRLLCYGHARAWRHDDGLPALKEPHP